MTEEAAALAATARARARQQRLVDRNLWQLLLKLAEYVETHGSDLTDQQVLEALERRDIKLVPWQRERLGAE